MKKFILIIFLSITTHFAFSQWEFQYFVLRVGANHHMMSPQPGDYMYHELTTPSGQMHLIPTNQFVDYVPGYHADLYFHFDFDSDKGGFVIGAEYGNNGTSAKYETENKEFDLTETLRIHYVGIPVFIKIGKEIFNEQKYFFIGGQYNYNLYLEKRQKVNFSSTVKKSFTTKDEFLRYNLVGFIGFNYNIFNIELDYLPGNFLNKEFIVNSYKPYETQPTNLFFVKTSLNVPLSSWTTKRNYTINRIVKRLKRIF